MSEEYSANVKMWLEIPFVRGVKKLIEVASVGNGVGTLVAEMAPWGFYVLTTGDLGELCIQIDKTLRRHKIRITKRENESGDFKYEKLEVCEITSSRD